MYTVGNDNTDEHIWRSYTVHRDTYLPRSPASQGLRERGSLFKCICIVVPPRVTSSYPRRLPSASQRDLPHERAIQFTTDCNPLACFKSVSARFALIVIGFRAVESRRETRGTEQCVILKSLFMYLVLKTHRHMTVCDCTSLLDITLINYLISVCVVYSLITFFILRTYDIRAPCHLRITRPTGLIQAIAVCFDCR